MEQAPPADARTAQKQDTRDRLLQVATALFARDGVDAVTIDQIAREAQTSRANFYLHFSGKSGLLNAMRRQMWLVAQDFYDAFAELPDTSEPTLLGWLRQLADAWARDVDRTRAILGATPHEIRVEYAAHLKDYIAALTRDRSKWPGLSDDEARRRAHLLIIQLAGFLADLHVYEMPWTAKRCCTVSQPCGRRPCGHLPGCKARPPRRRAH
jgi:AcrR family transcriptional regulator